MSNRVRAVATAVSLILRNPESRKELILLFAQLGYWHDRALMELLAGRKKKPKDRMLTVEEASELCKRSRSFLYERAESLGFGKRQEGAKGLRISERELRRWMGG